MGFFSGRVTFLRFKVSGSAPRVFVEEHLDRLGHRQAGRQRIASADGVEIGWTAGEHILDTDFTEAGGHLTPKLSLKRAVVLKEFAQQVETLYT